MHGSLHPYSPAITVPLKGEDQEFPFAYSLYGCSHIGGATMGGEYPIYISEMNSCPAASHPFNPHHSVIDAHLTYNFGYDLHN
jgi:hypothetical protein